MRPVNIAVAGAGVMGRAHMAVIAQNPQCLLSAIADPSEAAQALAQEHGVPWFATLDALLAKALPNGVILATPNALHVPQALQCMAAGVTVLVEKPIAHTLADAHKLVYATQTHSAKVLIGHHRAHSPIMRQAKAVIDEGRLGNLVRADFEAGQWLPDWRPTQDYRMGYSANRSQGGGVLLDLIHEVDAALWLLGDFEHVSGYAIHASSLEIDSDDCAGILMARIDGPIASIRVDYVSRKPVRRYTIVGDRGTATWDLRASTIVVEDATGSQVIDLTAGSFDVAMTYVSAMQELLAAIESNRPSTQPLKEGVRALTTVLRAKRVYS